jgi:hypothetical protein
MHLATFNHVANMVGWKSTAGSLTLVSAVTSQTMTIYDLSEAAWTVGNEALNVSVPGNLPSHVWMKSRIDSIAF